KKATELQGNTGGFGGRGGGGGRGALPTGPETLGSLPNSLATLIRQLEAADVAPTTQLAAAIADRHAQTTRLLARSTPLRPPAASGLQRCHARFSGDRISPVS